MTSIREEVDCLFFQKKILDTGTLLTLKQPVYVRGMSKSRACMYACRPTTGRAHLCNSSKIDKTNRYTNRAGRPGIAPTGDQNPLKTQQTQKETQKVKTNQTPIKSPKTLEDSSIWSLVLPLWEKNPMDYTRVQHVGISNHLKLS